MTPSRSVRKSGGVVSAGNGGRKGALAEREDRDLQRERRERPAAGAVALAKRGQARCSLSAGAEGATGGVFRDGYCRCRLRRIVAWAEKLEWRRCPVARRNADRAAARLS